MNDILLASLQKSGFGNITETIYSETTKSILLDWARKKIDQSNLESDSIISNECEIFYPAEVAFSGIRNASRKLGYPMPEKTIIYRRIDSEENGLFIDIINPEFQIKELKKVNLNFKNN